MKLSVLVAVLCMLCAHSTLASGDAKERTRISVVDIEIIDGDTIRIGKTSYRLMGFDTPETYRARCEEESYLGHQAATRLSELVMSHDYIELDVHGLDKYRRRLAVLYAGGSDVGAILIKEGLAVAYNGRTKRKDWCNEIRSKNEEGSKN